MIRDETTGFLANSTMRNVQNKRLGITGSLDPLTFASSNLIKNKVIIMIVVKVLENQYSGYAYKLRI